MVGRSTRPAFIPTAWMCICMVVHGRDHSTNVAEAETMLEMNQSTQKAQRCFQLFAPRTVSHFRRRDPNREVNEASLITQVDGARILSAFQCICLRIQVMCPTHVPPNIARDYFEGVQDIWRHPNSRQGRQHDLPIFRHRRRAWVSSHFQRTSGSRSRSRASLDVSPCRSRRAQHRQISKRVYH